MSLHDELMADGAGLVHDTLGDDEAVWLSDAPSDKLRAIVGAIEVSERYVDWGRSQKKKKVEVVRVVLCGVLPERLPLQQTLAIPQYGETPFSITKIEGEGTHSPTLILERPTTVAIQKQGRDQPR